MGSWDNTTFVDVSDLELLRAAIEAVVAEDSYCPVDQPQIDKSTAYEMQYGSDTTCCIWGVAAIAGKSVAQWTAIKTAPFTILGRQSGRSLSPRIAHICRILRCNAVQLNLSDCDSEYSVECDQYGNSFISGVRENDLSMDMRFMKMPEFKGAVAQRPYTSPKVGIGVNRKRPFVLHDAFQKHVDENRGKSEFTVDALGRALTGFDRDSWGNQIQTQYLIPNRPLAPAGANQWYFQRAEDNP